MSQERASGLLEEVVAERPATVLHLGCGWAELLVQALQRLPAATECGVDGYAPDLVRGRTQALERGVAARLTLIEATRRPVRHRLIW